MIHEDSPGPGLKYPFPHAIKMAEKTTPPTPDQNFLSIIAAPDG
ncbi:hypothetical protein [Kitasatospora sp. NPDC005856]